MREFVGSLAILAVMICAGLYFAGWLTYEQSEDQATIQIKTQEIKEAANRAVEEGEKLIEKASSPATDEEEAEETTDKEAAEEDNEVNDSKRVVEHAPDVGEVPVSTTAPYTAP